MGNNVSTSVSNVTNAIDSELQQSAGAGSTTSCAITTGNITLTNANNCSVQNKNDCVASSSAGIDAIATASANSFQGASTAMKSALLGGTNVANTTQETINVITNKINQACSATSSATNSIATGNINIDGCTNSNILNINTGSAVANCAIATVQNAVIKAEQQVQTESQNTAPSLAGVLGISGLSLSSGVEYGLIVSSVCMVLICFIIILLLLLK